MAELNNLIYINACYSMLFFYLKEVFVWQKERNSIITVFFVHRPVLRLYVVQYVFSHIYQIWKRKAVTKSL